ncbi:MAG: hypothetical protein QNJ00_05235 [Woeseiaceae bacterium]|nr:hypothetical protein [Woeseiaceae bacterium]
MSHSFYIDGVGDASLEDTLAALPFDDLVVLEDFNGGWPDIAHIYQDNVSVRSVETAMEDGRLQVRIMANSSPDDFRLAAAIVDHVAGKYGKDIDPEDNETMSLAEWREAYGEDWQENQAKTYLQMLVSMYQGERHDGNLTMWGTRQQIEVGPRLMEPLLAEPETFSKNFFDRFRRLNYLDREDVFGPSLLAARDEQTGKQAVFSVLGDEAATALSSQAAFVVLTHDDPAEEDGRGRTILTFDDFASIAGDSITWLGDAVAVTPPYSGEAWQALVAAAQEKKTDLFDHPELLRDSSELTSVDDDAADTLGIPNEFWGIIAHSVVATFFVVAAADGNIDKGELEAFQKSLMLGAVGMGGSNVMQRATMQAAMGFEETLKDLVNREADALAQIIAGARQVVAVHLGDEEAALFAEALIAMAESIASASGGGFLGLGSKISAEERQVLDGLRTLLQLS